MYRRIALFLSRPKVRIAILLSAVLMCALGLRLYGIGWDSGYFLHPDEHTVVRIARDIHLPDWPLSLSQLLDAEQSPLNPHFFIYGSFPLYLLKAVGSVLSNFNETLADTDLRLVGRGLAAFFDTGTVLLIYLLGRRLYSHRTGILAAVLATFTVILIQHTHFSTVDSLLVFLVSLTVFFTARVLNRSPGLSKWTAIAIGISLGLAIATKTSALILVAAILTVYTLRCFKSEGDSISRSDFQPSCIKSSIAGVAIVGVVTFITVAIAQPYIFIDWGTFTADTRFIRDTLMTRSTDMPWTRQFIDTAPYLYQIQHLSVWGMGLPLSIAAWSGLIFSIGTAVLKRHKSDLMLLSWIIPFFIINGLSEVRFLRYFLPLVPFLCLFAARLFFELYDRLSGNRRRLVVVLLVLVIICTVGYSFAHVRIYSRQHPAVQVADWVYNNTDREATVAVEHWEFLLYLVRQERIELPVFDDDTPEKIAGISRQLLDADYSVILTNRQYGSISRLRERYPLTSRYYELLFSGELGFELVYCASSYPSLFKVNIADDTFSRPGLPVPEGLDMCSPCGITVNMGFADENHTVFDHPLSMVFKKVTYKTEQEIFALIMGEQ
jgi:hypothetical protein